SDEGFFLTGEARTLSWSRQAFAGVVERASGTASFADFGAVVHMIARGGHSILFFFDSPAVVHAHAIALGVSAALLAIGLGTRIVKWTTPALFASIFTRGDIAAGGEEVFFNFLFLLALSRAGEAYSVDALFRRLGRHPRPPSAIPTWPRLLLLLALIPIF